MPPARQEAFFLGEGEGERFCVACRTDAPPRGSVLILPPFAEEMNKSRRMMALAARLLAEQGWLVLRPDLAGTGDSAGDFGAATWGGWLDDIDRAWRWLEAASDGPRWLLGLRAGALLASDWLARSEAEPDLLMWQPVSAGEQHLTQFLRIKAASEMLTDSDARGVVSNLKASLHGGVPVEVAGYTICPALADAMGAAKFKLREGYAGRVCLVEVLAAGRESHSPGFSALVSRLPGASGHSVAGPGFWQSVEIEECPALIDLTVQLMDGRDGCK